MHYKVVVHHSKAVSGTIVPVGNVHIDMSSPETPSK